MENWQIACRKMVLGFLVLMLLCVSPMPIKAESDTSYGMTFRKIQTLLLNQDEPSIIQAKQLFEGLVNDANNEDEQMKQQILDHFDQQEAEKISVKMYHLSYLGVKQALDQKDIEQAAKWFEIREQKIKFSKEATPGLQAIVELKQDSSKIDRLKPVIEKDLKELYVIKLKDAIADAQAPLKAFLYFEMVEQDLQQGDLLPDQVKTMRAILENANQQGKWLDSDQKKLNEILATYFAKQVSQEDLKNQAKKMLTLLDYTQRNWEVALKEEKVFNAVEYAELQAFSRELQQRFRQIHDAWPKEALIIEQDLEQIDQALKNKQLKEEINPTLNQLMEKLSQGAGVSLPKASGGETTTDPQKILQQTLSVLEKSKQAYLDGKQQEAYDLTFDAYFVFEPLETKLSVKDKGAVQQIEQSFAELKASIQANQPIDSQLEQLKDQLTKAVSELTATTNGWGVFVQSLIIIVREGFEAIIIIAALIAYLEKTKQEKKYIYYGALSAIVASLVSAYLIRAVFQLSGANQEAIEGFTMLIAVAVLFYVSYWMISQVQGKRWQQYIQGKMQTSIAKGSYITMGFVAFLAVYREGFETILFYQALFSLGENESMIIYGFAVGSLLLAALYLGLSRYSVKIPIKPFFLGTSFILYFMAFSFSGHGIFELQEGGYVTATYLTGWPTISLLGIYPTVETMMAQSLLVFAVIVALGWMIWKKGASKNEKKAVDSSYSS